jgi:hypothetical protein
VVKLSNPRNHPVNLETWDLLPRNLETRNPVSRYKVNPVIWNPGNPEPGELTTTGRTNKTPMSDHRGFCVSWEMIVPFAQQMTGPIFEHGLRQVVQ